LGRKEKLSTPAISIEFGAGRSSAPAGREIVSSPCPVSIESMAGFLFGYEARKEKILSVLGCYMDESVDKDEKKVFCVGAVIGNDAKWQWLEGEWRAIFSSEGISYFKASDCAAMSGEFRKFRKDDNTATEIEKRKGEEVRRKLLERMSESRVSSFGVSIDMDDFRAVTDTPEKLEAFGGTPFYHCYFLTMHQCAAQIKKHIPNDVLAFGYDEHQNYGPHLRSVYDDFKAKNPHVAPYMTTLAPFDDKVFVPIQVADLVASIVRKYTLWKIAKPRPSMPYELRLLERKNTMGEIDICQKSCLNDFLSEKGLA
jgi:hypothetical protein